MSDGERRPEPGTAEPGTAGPDDDDAGWAAPHLPPREPETTSGGPPPPAGPPGGEVAGAPTGTPPWAQPGPPPGSGQGGPPSPPGETPPAAGPWASAPPTGAPAPLWGPPAGAPGPATGASGPWAAPPTATRRRRRRRWPWVLGGVLTLIVALGVTGTVLYVTNVKPVIDAANAVFDDVEEGDDEQAFARLCAEDRDRFTPGEIGAALGRFEDASVDPFSVDISGDDATVEFDASVSPDPDTDTFELGLRREGGDWRPCLSEA